MRPRLVLTCKVPNDQPVEGGAVFFVTFDTGFGGGEQPPAVAFHPGPGPFGPLW